MKLPKLPTLPPIVARLLSPITSRIQAHKDKKAAQIAEAAKQAAIQADKQLIDELVAGLPNTESLMVRTCLENQMAYINQDLAARPPSSLVGTKKIMMALARRVMMHLLQFRGVVGIQPMQAPASLVYSMRFGDGGTVDGAQQMRLEVVSNAVAARTQKLQACYSIEAAHDMARMHDIDFEKEIVSILATECAEDYARLIITDLIGAGEQLVATGETGPFMATAVDNVIVTINKAANQIAQHTRRGAGNVLIMSPIALAMLSSSKTFQFTKDNNLDVSAYFLQKVGHVGNAGVSKQYTVYTSLDPRLSQDGKETIIVGYKGGSGECDTAYILCPYIPVTSSGVVIDPRTFAPQVQLMTRYGLFVADGSENTMYDVKNYYRTVTFDLTKFIETLAV